MVAQIKSTGERSCKKNSGLFGECFHLKSSSISGYRQSGKLLASDRLTYNSLASIVSRTTVAEICKGDLLSPILGGYGELLSVNYRSDIVACQRVSIDTVGLSLAISWLLASPF